VVVAVAPPQLPVGDMLEAFFKFPCVFEQDVATVKVAALLQSACE
jgi:hypothetical protein